MILNEAQTESQERRANPNGFGWILAARTETRLKSPIGQFRGRHALHREELLTVERDQFLQVQAHQVKEAL